MTDAPRDMSSAARWDLRFAITAAAFVVAAGAGPSFEGLMRAVSRDASTCGAAVLYEKQSIGMGLAENTNARIGM
jgi:hypothetical protein